jgi:uncharacterized protein (TIGR03083 family)
MGTDRDLVDQIESVWRSVDELCSSLSEEEWKTPTDLPGWTVQDNVSHIIDIEQRFHGLPAPEHIPADVSHTRNEFGAHNEIGVDYRRGRTGAEVLSEFRDITAQRLDTFRSWGEEDFAKKTWTPLGEGTWRDMLPIRTLDCWVHEQDIRRALGRPGHLDGPAAATTYQRLSSALAYVVGKKVKPPDGTVVRLEVEGADPAVTFARVRDGRGEAAPDASEATVDIHTDLEAFVALATGRWDAARALEQRRVRLSGDEDLGRRILDELSVTP